MPRSMARAWLLNRAHATWTTGHGSILCLNGSWEETSWPVSQSVSTYRQIQHLVIGFWVGTALWRVKSNVRDIAVPWRGAFWLDNANHADFLPQLFICTSHPYIFSTADFSTLCFLVGGSHSALQRWDTGNTDKIWSSIRTLRTRPVCIVFI